MIYRVPITKDNTISTWSEIPSLRNLGNSGKSQIVDVWGNYRADKNLRFITRFLGEANLTALQAAISNTSVPDPVTDSTVSCNLKFFNINSAEVEAYEYTLQVFPVTRSWQEGRGTRIDSFTNTAFSNWLSASNTAAWSNTGGDFDTSVTASQYFESGSENLNINTRTMLVNWLSGASANYGFIVKMAQPAEDFGSLSTGTQYYRKSFHGRLTNYPNFAPYFQLEWVSQIVDDRSILTFGNTANLYFYNAPNGIYTDIDSVTSSFPGKVTLSGSIQGVSGALSASTAIVTDNGPASGYWPVVTNITPLRVKKGVYRALFTLPTSASIFNKFTDVWNVTSAASAVTLSSGLIFHPTSTVSGETNYANLDMNISIPGWKNVYDKNSIINKKVYFIEKTGKVIPLTQSEKNSISSISSSTQTTFISTDGYWRILTDALGSVDVDWQKLEYDGHSNFFTIDLSNFARQVRYQLEFKIAVRGNTMIFDNQNGSNIHYFEVF